MLLKELFEGIDYKIYNNEVNPNITGLCYDSRKINYGEIFICLHGSYTDGKYFVNEAISKGACAVLSDEFIEIQDKNVPLIVVDDLLKIFSKISAKFYNYPSLKLNIIGVTGTNGKTTITYLLESIFNLAGYKTSVIGTINYRIGNKIIQGINTTPFASQLQHLLDLSVKSKVSKVIMEVSSHGLVTSRVDDCEFDTGIFTNLTRDHLDFHNDFDNYFNAKLKLFEMLTKEYNKKLQKFAIINSDDDYGCKIIEYLKDKKNIRVFTYGLNKKSEFTATDIKHSINKIIFKIKNGKNNSVDITTELIGQYNVYNILAAYACAYANNIPPETIKKGIENVKNIPGRLEKIYSKKGFYIVIDYAHTDNALKNVLTTLKELNPKRIITVFGCGGERDRSKRPIMGEVASNLSDFVILTNDNPRKEEPDKILLDIEIGIKRIGKENYRIIKDRREAIKQSIEMAKKGDIILIAGKGHENYQIIGNEYQYFNDKEEVHKQLFE